MVGSASNRKEAVFSARNNGYGRSFMDFSIRSFVTFVVLVLLLDDTGGSIVAVAVVDEDSTGGSTNFSSAAAISSASRNNVDFGACNLLDVRLTNAIQGSKIAMLSAIADIVDTIFIAILYFKCTILFSIIDMNVL